MNISKDLKHGDKIICIDNKNVSAYIPGTSQLFVLELQKVYTFDKYLGSDCVTTVELPNGGFFTRRFEFVSIVSPVEKDIDYIELAKQVSGSL